MAQETVLGGESQDPPPNNHPPSTQTSSLSSGSTSSRSTEPHKLTKAELDKFMVSLKLKPLLKKAGQCTLSREGVEGRKSR
jgi:hypothetical protein